MEMIIKTIGIHRSIRELSLAWEAMNLGNRTYEDDLYDTARLPFEAVYTLLAHLGVDLGDETLPTGWKYGGS